MSRYKMLSIFMLLVSVGIATRFVNSLDSEDVRYKIYPNHYKALFKDSNKNQNTVLFLGSSRSQTAVSEAGLLSSLAELNENCTVDGYRFIDLSKSLSGLGFQYRMLNDYFEARPNLEAKTVIFLEFKKTNYYNPLHAYFYQVATYSDIWESSMVTKRDDRFLMKLREFLHLSTKKVTNALSAKLLGRELALRSELIKEVTKSDLIFDPTLFQLVAPDGIASYEAAHKDKWESRSKIPWKLDDPYEQRILYYAKKIKELAHDNNAQVVFHRTPVLYQQMLDEAAVDGLGKLDISLIQPGIEVLKDLYDGNYGDGGHMSESGSKLYLSWLMNHPEAKARLCS